MNNFVNLDSLKKDLNIKSIEAFDSVIKGREKVLIDKVKTFPNNKTLSEYVTSALSTYQSTYLYRMDCILGTIGRQINKGEICVTSKSELLVLLSFVSTDEAKTLALYSPGAKGS